MPEARTSGGKWQDGLTGTCKTYTICPPKWCGSILRFGEVVGGGAGSALRCPGTFRGTGLVQNEPDALLVLPVVEAANEL
jgi:hypothetical protein